MTATMTARPRRQEAAIPGWVRLGLALVAVAAPVLVALDAPPLVRAPVVVALTVLGPGLVLVPRMGLSLSSAAILVPVVSLSITTAASLAVVYAFPSSGSDPAGIGGWSTMAVVIAVAVVVALGAALPGRQPDVEVVTW